MFVNNVCCLLFLCSTLINNKANHIRGLLFNNNNKMLYAIVFLIVNVINIIALERNCASCGWFIKNNNGRIEDGMCKLFSTTTIHGAQENVIHEYAKHCRGNEDFCGKKGLLYEDSIELNLQKAKLEKLKNIDIDLYNYHMFLNKF
jgi:hypothetical protein